MQHLNFQLSDLPVSMVIATHRTIRDCNTEFATLFGYSPEELRDTGFHLLYPNFADFVRTGQMWNSNLATGATYHDERIMLHRDQSRFWCAVHGRSNNLNDPFAQAIYCFLPIPQRAVTNAHQLTDRQMQIVTLVAQGKKSSAIAHETGVSVRTIEAHRARIMRKIGVRNSAELVGWFHALS